MARGFSFLMLILTRVKLCSRSLIIEVKSLGSPKEQAINSQELCAKRRKTLEMDTKSLLEVLRNLLHSAEHKNSDRLFSRATLSYMI